ncbi:MAG: hypothetical protein OXH99_10630 [Bryobacterales bacterium]|nr:hypothetical protein [Bryobacterales bacterium]
MRLRSPAEPRRLPTPDELSASARQSGKPFVALLMKKLMDRALAAPRECDVAMGSDRQPLARLQART